MQRLVLAAVTAIFLPGPVSYAEDGAALYRKQCAECYHIERIGHTAPPMFPDFISKKNKASEKNPDRLLEVIRDGLPAMQMPGYGKKLSAAEIESIAKFIMTPAKGVKWSKDDIMASRKNFKAKGGKKNGAEPTNITLVMEKGTKNLALLNGDNKVLVYDTKSFKKIAEIPADHPSGIFCTSRLGDFGL